MKMKRNGKKKKVSKKMEMDKSSKIEVKDDGRKGWKTYKFKSEQKKDKSSKKERERWSHREFDKQLNRYNITYSKDK